MKLNFSQKVKERLEKLNQTPSGLAREMGYSPQYVLDLLAGHRRWNETTMGKACEVLGIRVKFVDLEKGSAE